MPPLDQSRINLLPLLIPVSMAEQNKYLVVSDDSEEFDYDLDLNETEMLWERKIKEVTAATLEPTCSNLTTGDSATNNSDQHVPDEMNSAPSPPLIHVSADTSSGDTHATNHDSASRQNRLNAFKDNLINLKTNKSAMNDCLETYRTAVDSENLKMNEASMGAVGGNPTCSIETVVTQRRQKIADRLPSFTEIDSDLMGTEDEDKELRQRESSQVGLLQREASQAGLLQSEGSQVGLLQSESSQMTDVDEEKAVVVSFYDNIDLTDETITEMDDTGNSQ